MKLSYRGQYIFKVVFILSMSVLFFLALYGGIRDQHIDLSKRKKVYGIVENLRTETSTRSKGRKSNDLYIQLAGFPRKLKVGRVLKNYDDLTGVIEKGDLLTVYYDENASDLSVIEIQRKNEILLHKSEYEKRASIILIIGVAGILSCAYIVYDLRKKYRQKIENSY